MMKTYSIELTLAEIEYLCERVDKPKLKEKFALLFRSENTLDCMDWVKARLQVVE